MKERIENLLSAIGQQMQEHLSNRDFVSVTESSKLLSRIQQLQKRAIELNDDVSEIEASFRRLNGKLESSERSASTEEVLDNEKDADDGARAGHKTLRIEADWQANGKNHEKEIILYPKAADSMVRFLSQIVDLFGLDALQKLRGIKINRGPLLSKAPTVDFLNRVQGTTYGHKRLPGTDYFVLTHSQTSQKAQDLDRICRVLGLVPGSVRIREVNKADYYSEALQKLL